ncbi:uncharacterized protein [Littorina saxatilis]|uniref:uncharacterized protein n=1 Tax=Littorina saxatilis TaxID=31220 RepID=UPI0038B46C5A
MSNGNVTVPSDQTQTMEICVPFLYGVLGTGAVGVIVVVLVIVIIVLAVRLRKRSPFPSLNNRQRRQRETVYTEASSLQTSCASSTACGEYQELRVDEIGMMSVYATGTQRSPPAGKIPHEENTDGIYENTPYQF